MASSLAQQLQKLAAPQTSSVLADARSRASILFDPKEAATKDRRAIFEIGVSGLQELTALNSTFKEFQLTLFDEAALTLERAVEDKEVNDLLDASITKFLRLLSPYFMLRPAHMCFEWLLRRFQVHEYNREQVMALILPYHETNTFVQVLQTMRLRQSDEDWFWLRRLQRPGVPLSKTAIVNRAASVPSFLSFICRSTHRAVKELGPRAHQLQAQLNFYSTVVVGALQAAKPLEDWHISTILESLLRGLASDTVDFVAAAYVVVAQLVSRTKLKEKVCNALLERVANCTFERLHTTALLLLIWIHDKQQAANPQFTTKTMLNLVCQKWLITALADLAKENVAIQAICLPLLRGSVAAIREGDASSAVSHQQFLDNLLSEVPFTAASAQQLINCFLDTFVALEEDNIPVPMDTSSNDADDDTIIIDSDDEMMPVKTDFQTWYTEYLAKLERRYPEAFDLSVKTALSAKSKSTNRRKALRLALGFRLNTTDEKAQQAYEKLYHYSDDWRLAAVQQLLQNLKIPKRRERSMQLLKECLPDRIKDENAGVVAALLALPTADFVEMLGAESFAETLCELLRRSQLQRQTDWDTVVPQAVQHLTTAVVSNSYDPNLLLLALMPYLFPSDDLNPREHAALLLILGSHFATKVPFLCRLQVESTHSVFKASDHRQQFLEVIASAGETVQQQQQALLDSVEQHGGVDFLRGEVPQLTYLLLLLTAYARRQLSPAEGLQMLQRIGVYSKGFQFKRIKKYGKAKDPEHVSLQLYVDFLQTLAQNTQFAGLSQAPWTALTDELRLCLLLLDTLCSQVYAEDIEEPERREWTRALKKCMNHMLPERQQKLDFLCNFYVYETLPELGVDYPVLRVRGCNLMQAVLSTRPKSINCSLMHVLRIANACNSPLQTFRFLALSTLDQLKLKTLEPHVEHLVSRLLQRKSELSMDNEQYALVLHTILESSKGIPRELLMLSKLRRSLLELICDVEQPAICTAALLRALKHMNNEKLLAALLPLGKYMLDKITVRAEGEQLEQLTWPHSDIYCAVIERFEGEVGLHVLAEKPEAWQLIEASFRQHTTYVQLDQKLQPLPCVLLNALTPDTFAQLQAKHKMALFQLIVVAATSSDNDSIFLSAQRLLKRCTIECKPLTTMLTDMCNRSTRKPAETRRSAVQPKLDLTCEAWKQGMTLLELLEHKKQLVGAELLIPPLFELLQLCLTLEEHSAAEYPKQLILSSLLHCCDVAQAAGVQLSKVLPESCFRIEQVVQCLRNTQNPQTQQHALLFLTRCAALYPQQVLHKIVEIFTFVGSTVARHDDAFSLHIIKKVVETIIPTLLLQSGAQRDRLVIPVLKVFADICTDVPVHRRLTLYETLFSVLHPGKHLYQFLCIVFEAQMLLEQAPQTVKGKAQAKGKPAKQLDKSRLEFARELTVMFKEPSVLLYTCQNLLDYLATLPLTSQAQAASSTTSSGPISPEQQLFDVRTRSFKQLRHYKYLIIDFLSGLSSSPEFQAILANPQTQTMQKMKPLYQDFILKTLSYVGVVNTILQQSSQLPSLEKYWRVMANHVHDVLDNAIGLLSPEYFLNVITELLQHELIHVRIKVLELLVTKLLPSSEYFVSCEAQHFGILFEPLGAIVDGILDATGGSSAQQAQLQQAALHALQLLAQRHGRDYLDECRELLAKLTRIAKRRANVPRAVVGNVVLTLVEICGSIKAHALAQLPKFAPQLTELLKEQVQQMLTQKQTPDYVCSALVTAMHKLFLTLPLFLGPYLVDIIGALIRLSVQLENPQFTLDKRTQALKLRMMDVWTAVAQGVNARILVPSCAKTYSSLLESQDYDELGMLMRQLLLPCIKHNTNADLQPVQDALSELFLQALEFRLQMREVEISRERVASIEAATTEAFVTWILKLSESSFRPMYAKVHKWAMDRNDVEPQLTYFLLTNRIAEALKSLFVLFAGDFIEDAARLLQSNNTQRPEYVEHNNVEDSVELISAIISTLHHVFLHCSSDLVNDHRFSTLMPPIVDQLENQLVLANEQDALQQSLSNCIAQLAAATNDVLWKQLNQQVLLKTRTSSPEVRILAFNSSVAIARKLGESFAPLLPETMPFIAELLEDEHERVEKNTRNAVLELESILGEPVQKYL